MKACESLGGRFIAIRPPARVVALALAAAMLLLAVAGLRPLLGQTTDALPDSSTPSDPAATAPTSLIAYVEDKERDEIRLIAPDGSNDRRLWAHGLADPHDVYEVTTLTWRRDAAALAFASTHEAWCSINDTDIFTINADGSGYQRVTEAPSCAALRAYPKGTVRVPVRNASSINSFTGFVYFQGAPGILPVSLPPGGNTVLTFNDVADFGDGLQVAAMIVGNTRAPSTATAVDVLANSTVTTGQMGVYVPSGPWGAHSPTWRSDGSAIGYVLNFNSLRYVLPTPEPLDFGTPLQTNQTAMPDFADMLAWGPPTKATQLLYRGNTSYDAQGVYLLPEGSATAGQRVVTHDWYPYVRGLAWLPDGSGFVYSLEELDDTYTPTRANIFLYRFGGGPVRLTNFSNQFATQLSVSPDGSRVVFERAAVQEYGAPTDLWIMNINGTDQRLLKANAGAPAWSPGALRTPKRAFLPALLGSQ